MRVLITGATGFVGSHVGGALRSVCGASTRIIATSRRPSSDLNFGEFESLDVTNRHAVDEAVRRHNPTHVLHLAAVAAPVEAAQDPEMAWRVHVGGTLNLANSILRHAPRCCLINAGSGLVYGASACSGMAMDESTILAPVDDYAVTKAAADLALGAMVRRGLKCVRVRPFNHAGPGQSEAFVLPAFALQIAKIEAGLSHPVVRVGNLDAERDFLDVRDVATAYAQVVAGDASLDSGTILNLASGKWYRIGFLLEELLLLSREQISIEDDQTRMRGSEFQRIVGNAERASRILGWRPTITMKQTLADVLEDCRRRLSATIR